jgi:CheY-like chemotaxis protein
MGVVQRKMLMKTLTAAGHTCEDAEDGQQAVDKVRRCLYN